MPRFGVGVVASSGPSWSLHGGSGSNAGAHRLLMGKSEFFLIVIDEDRKQFTVEGPVADDRPWSTAIAAAQHEGRRIRCCNIGSKSRAHAMSMWQRHYGHFYHFVPPGRIVSLD
jgi:hypothetical protein